MKGIATVPLEQRELAAVRGKEAKKERGALVEPESAKDALDSPPNVSLMQNERPGISYKSERPICVPASLDYRRQVSGGTVLLRSIIPEPDNKTRETVSLQAA